MNKKLTLAMMGLGLALVSSYTIGFFKRNEIDMLNFCIDTTKNMLKDEDSFSMKNFYISSTYDRDSRIDLTKLPKIYPSIDSTGDPSVDAEGASISYPSVSVRFKASNSFGAYSTDVAKCTFAVKTIDGKFMDKIYPKIVSLEGRTLLSDSDVPEDMVKWITYAGAELTIKTNPLSPFKAVYYMLTGQEAQ